MTRDEKIKWVLAHPDAPLDEVASALGYKNADSARQFCKRAGLPNVRANVQAKRSGKDLKELVFQAIKGKRRSIPELANLFDVAPKHIVQALDSLQIDNILLDQSSDHGFQLATGMVLPEKPLLLDMSKHGEHEIGFGFVADTHLCSKYERLDVLESLYDRFQAAGIETVLHGGNWIDGEFRYNRYDIHTHGVEGQVDYFIRNYPAREGIQTKIISGDDHEGWYVQGNHVNIGQVMVDRAMKFGRFDLIDLGYMERDIELHQPDGSAIVRLIHAGGGSTYAHSYTAQKYVETLQGGEKPKVVLVGHYHKFNYSYPREVHVIQGGCTQDQTPFMRKRKLQAMVGGVIVWLRQAENGVITSVKVEWMPYYDKKFYAYKW